MTRQRKEGLAWALVIILAGLIISVTVDNCLRKNQIICEDCG